MLYNQPMIVSAVEAEFIWRLSFLCVLSFVYAVCRKYYDLALVPLAIWITSMVYWYHPVDGWRRYIDISVVALALSWQVYRAWFAEYRLIYYCVVGIAILFYVIGKLLDPIDSILSTIAHGALHVFANLSNLILYSGYIPPLY